MNLTVYTKSRLQEMEEELNLTDDELTVFHMLSKGKSIKEISMRIGLSTRAVDHRISAIRLKMRKIGENV